MGITVDFQVCNMRCTKIKIVVVRSRAFWQICAYITLPFRDFNSIIQGPSVPEGSEACTPENFEFVAVPRGIFLRFQLLFFFSLNLKKIIPVCTNYIWVKATKGTVSSLQTGRSTCFLAINSILENSILNFHLKI